MYPLKCKERGCRNSSGRENGVSIAVMGSILGGGKFEIKGGVLHAYDRWKGRQTASQPSESASVRNSKSKADRISSRTLIPIANLLRTSGESRNSDSHVHHPIARRVERMAPALSSKGGGAGPLSKMRRQIVFCCAALRVGPTPARITNVVVCGGR